MSERVAVTCRLCPRGGKDERGDITVPKRGRGLITAKTANNNLEFALDDVFDWESTQESVYESIGRARVDRVLNGTDSCVLAYGQTGSGKTHTMFGSLPFHLGRTASAHQKRPRHEKRTANKN